MIDLKNLVIYKRKNVSTLDVITIFKYAIKSFPLFIYIAIYSYQFTKLYKIIYALYFQLSIFTQFLIFLFIHFVSYPFTSHHEFVHIYLYICLHFLANALADFVPRKRNVWPKSRLSKGSRTSASIFRAANSNFSTIELVDCATIGVCTTFSFADLQTRKKARSGLVGGTPAPQCIQVRGSARITSRPWRFPKSSIGVSILKKNPLSCIFYCFISGFKIFLDSLFFFFKVFDDSSKITPPFVTIRIIKILGIYFRFFLNLGTW